MNIFRNGAVRLVTLLLISLNILPGGTLARGIENKRTLPEPKREAAYGKFPLLFEQNAGQTDAQAKFIARGSGYQLYLTKSGAKFNLQHVDGKVLKMDFAGANKNAVVEGADAAVTKTNYYTGRRRYENIANFQRVFYRGLYKGIDAVFYGSGNSGRDLEYDFVVAPGADAARIKLDFDGADNIRVNENGDLVIKTGDAELAQKKPYAYQDIDGRRVEIAAAYQVDKDKVTFALGEYDRARTLVIDPVVSYLTYIGGSAFDDVKDVKADANGNAYITGSTESLNFHGRPRDSRDESGVYVAKVNAAGTAFLYVTFVDGPGIDFPKAIAIDSAGSAYVAGTASRNFPTTANAFDDNIGGGGDGFVTKLNGAGTISYSTYIGGGGPDDGSEDIAVDAAGRAYVTGSTLSGLTFPKKNEFMGCGVGELAPYAAYLTVLNSTGTDITYSTCLGGNFTDIFASGLALDAAGNAYITGFTGGNDLPIKAAFQNARAGGDDAFVAKFNPSASGAASLMYSSYLGGTGTDRGQGIGVDLLGQAHITGVTGSANFPLKNPIDSTNQINEAFVTVVSSLGTSLVNSTFLGGAQQESGRDIKVMPSGTIFVTGETLSSDFPSVQAFQPARAGLRDVFITKMKFGAGNGISMSSFLGGSGNDLIPAVDVQGSRIYIAGKTESTNLQTTTGSIKTVTDANAENTDGFVAMILETQFDSVGVFRPAAVFTLIQSLSNITGQTATFATPLSGARGVSGDWNGDDIDTIGSFTDGVWKVRDINFPPVNVAPKTINFGQPGDLPVVGDWNGDGIDTPGVFRPGAGTFFLTNSTATTPPVDLTIIFGANGDLPVAGDWNADGIDTVGVFRPADGAFFLADENVQAPPIAQVVFFGIAEDLPTAGDWDADGFDTPGVWRPSTQQFFLTNDGIKISNFFTFGAANSQPIAGDWDGRPN